MKVTSGIARRLFDAHIEYLRRLAKEKNVEFDILLNSFMPPESKNKRLAALLCAPHVRDASALERYRPFFYEWQIEMLMVDAEAHHKNVRSKIRGGKLRGEQMKQKSNERQVGIVAKRAELIAAGYRPRGLNKRIANALNDDAEYVRKCLRAWDKSSKTVAS